MLKGPSSLHSIHPLWVLANFTLVLPGCGIANFKSSKRSDCPWVTVFTQNFNTVLGFTTSRYYRGEYTKFDRCTFSSHLPVPKVWYYASEGERADLTIAHIILVATNSSTRFFVERKLWKLL